MRWFRWLALLAAVLTIGAWSAYAGALFLLQDALVFPAPHVERAVLDARAAAAGVTVLEPIAEDGTHLYAWHAATASDRVLLFLHGNGGGVTAAPWFATHLDGWDVVTLSYRGYPGSQGAPSEAGLVLDARAAWRLITEDLGFPPERVVVQGQSLGGGVALHLLEEAEPAGLVLDSTFHSLEELAARQAPGLPVSLLLRHPFRSWRRAPSVQIPALVMHGDADHLIPVDHGRRLAALLPRAEYVELPGLGHDSWLLDDPAAYTAWQAFLERVVPSLP